MYEEKMHGSDVLAKSHMMNALKDIDDLKAKCLQLQAENTRLKEPVWLAFCDKYEFRIFRTEDDATRYGDNSSFDYEVLRLDVE